MNKLAIDKKNLVCSVLKLEAKTFHDEYFYFEHEKFELQIDMRYGDHKLITKLDFIDFLYLLTNI